MAKERGDGYWIMTWFQWVFLECMFVLQFKSIDSQNALGYGEIGGAPGSHTNDYSGACDTSGLFSGSNNLTTRIKAFGIEELWGYYGRVYADGIVVRDNGETWIQLDNYTFENHFENADKWTKCINAIDNYKGWGYLKTCNGSTEAPFIPVHTHSSGTGSETTYYCDYIDYDGNYSGMDANRYIDVPLVSSSYINLSGADYRCCGLFCIDTIGWNEENRSSTGARLCYY